MIPIVNKVAMLTYKKLPKKAQYATLLVIGVAMASYAAYRLVKARGRQIENSEEF